MSCLSCVSGRVAIESSIFTGIWRINCQRHTVGSASIVDTANIMTRVAGHDSIMNSQCASRMNAACACRRSIAGNAAATHCNGAADQHSACSAITPCAQTSIPGKRRCLNIYFAHRRIDIKTTRLVTCVVFKSYSITGEGGHLHTAYSDRSGAAIVFCKSTSADGQFTTVGNIQRRVAVILHLATVVDEYRIGDGHIHQVSIALYHYGAIGVCTLGAVIGDGTVRNIDRFASVRR